jgi:curli biogenesis system outer membrane secretion channel CsgG
MTHVRSFVPLALASALVLAACQGTPQLGQGGSLAQGSGGSEGDGQANTQLTRCSAPIGTAALVEPDQQNMVLLNQAQLPSPLPVVQLLMAQSNCFRVVERGAAIAAIEAEQRRSGKQVRLEAADYMIKPNILFSNPNAGGYGGLAGIGSIFGPVGLLAGMAAGSIRIQEAQTTLALIDVGSGVQRAIAEGSAKVQDFGGVGGIAGFGGGIGGLGGIGGYGNTAEGKLIVAALIDSHNKLVAIIQNDQPVRATTRSTGGGYDREVVRAIQHELQAEGYYTSGIDGLYGNGTRAAIVAYQQDNGLTADGRPTSDLLRHLQNGQ